MNFSSEIDAAEGRGDALWRLLGANEPAELALIRSARQAALLREHWQPVRRLLSAISAPPSVPANLGSAVVQIGDEATLDPGGRKLLRELVRRLMPWRKGPFSLCGEFIDAEWRSDMKWDRIQEAIPPLAGLRVLDVGCNNGYYLFRAAGHGATQEDPPEILLGIDPSEAFFFAFSLFQLFLRHPRIHYELLGIEHLDTMRDVFDVILCLGIVYHQRDPLRSLQLLRESLRKGGVAIIESQTIPGDGSFALFPAERYGKAHNVYFVPTRDCLVSWLKRAGFQAIEVVSETPVTSEEQRRTSLMEFESLSDFLDPANPGKTIEGHPAPWRTAVRAVRK